MDFLTRKPCSRTTRFRQRGFTLVELLASIAIVAILCALALPAYNNYAAKSKFAETVIATAPTKVAIDVCAAGGDCVSGNAIYLGGQSAPSMLDYLNLQYQPPYYSSSDVNALMANYASGGYYMAAAPYFPAGTYCMLTPQSPDGCQTEAIAMSFTPTKPYAVPCVGAAPCAPPSKYVTSVSAAQNGVITATAASSAGLLGETFTLTPSYSSGRVEWLISGSCKTRAGGALC